MACSLLARSYRRAATRAPKPRTPAEAILRWPAEESDEVDSAASPVLEAEDSESLVPLASLEEDESSLLSELPVDDESELESVAVPVAVAPETMVAPEGSSTTTVVELPTETSKEVREREMLMAM